MWPYIHIRIYMGCPYMVILVIRDKAIYDNSLYRSGTAIYGFVRNLANTAIHAQVPYIARYAYIATWGIRHIYIYSIWHVSVTGHVCPIRDVEALQLYENCHMLLYNELVRYGHSRTCAIYSSGCLSSGKTWSSPNSYTLNTLEENQVKHNLSPNSSTTYELTVYAM